MKVLIVIALCLVAVVVAEPPECPQGDQDILSQEELSEQVHELVDRVKRVKENVVNMGNIGRNQIEKLNALITSASCLALGDVTVVAVPTPPAEEAPRAAEAAAELTEQELSNHVATLKCKVTAIEVGIARMKHIGLTNIDKLNRFEQLVKGQLCPAAGEESTNDDD